MRNLIIGILYNFSEKSIIAENVINGHRTHRYQSYWIGLVSIEENVLSLLQPTEAGVVAHVVGHHCIIIYPAWFHMLAMLSAGSPVSWASSLVALDVGCSEDRLVTDDEAGFEDGVWKSGCAGRVLRGNYPAEEPSRSCCLGMPRTSRS